MSKVAIFGEGHRIYFEHCPFCGSVEVDFDRKTFRCPDCGAVVTFELPKDEELICDGPTDEEIIINRWNRRKGKEITADDLCVMAQKTIREDFCTYIHESRSEVWPYILQSAKLGKFHCRIPAKLLPNPEFYEKKKFTVERYGSAYDISWDKNIEWN